VNGTGVLGPGRCHPDGQPVTDRPSATIALTVASATTTGALAVGRSGGAHPDQTGSGRLLEFVTLLRVMLVVSPERVQQQGPVAQLVSASPCHGEGRGFESRLGREKFRWVVPGHLSVKLAAKRPGQVAQLVRATA
jgi:hypothetical protein